jgi:hypothetical protein
MNDQIPVHQRDFGWAIRAMKNGHAVRRHLWTQIEPGPQVLVSVRLDQPEGYAPMFVATLHDGTRIPLFPNAFHQLAEDWELA